MNNALGRSVQNINPGLWVQLDRVLKDLEGSVGYTVMPVIIRFGQGLRMVADTIATVSTTTDKFWAYLDKAGGKLEGVGTLLQKIFVVEVDTLESTLESFLDVLGEVIDEVASWANAFDESADDAITFTDAIEFVGEVLITSGILVKKFYEAIKQFMSGELPDIDIAGAIESAFAEAQDKMKQVQITNSYALGGRQASYSSFEDFAKQARISAFQLGRTPEQNRMEKLAEEQCNIQKQIEINTRGAQSETRTKLEEDWRKREVQINPAVNPNNPG